MEEFREFTTSRCPLRLLRTQTRSQLPKSVNVQLRPPAASKEDSRTGHDLQYVPRGCCGSPLRRCDLHEVLGSRHDLEIGLLACVALKTASNTAFVKPN
jgi:hypothetical protein